MDRVEGHTLKWMNVYLLVALWMGVSTPAVQAQERKDPLISCLLTAVVPSVGQYYNGTENEVVKGIFQDAVIFGGGVVANAGGANTSVSDRTLGYSLIFCSWAWAVIDAPISSDDINAGIARAQQGPPGLGLSPATSGAGDPRSVVLSCLFSAVVPGLGQYYNGTEGEVIKGAIQEIGIVAPLVYNSDHYNDRAADFVEVFMIVGSYLWSVIDAPICAADINREAHRSKVTSIDLNTHLVLLNDSDLHVVPGAEMSLRF